MITPLLERKRERKRGGERERREGGKGVEREKKKIREEEGKKRERMHVRLHCARVCMNA